MELIEGNAEEFEGTLWSYWNRFPTVEPKEFAFESCVISDYIERSGVSTFIDIGAWMGLLTRSISIRNPEVNIYSVEPLTPYTEVIRELVPEATIYNVLLVSNGQDPILRIGRDTSRGGLYFRENYCRFKVRCDGMTPYNLVHDIGLDICEDSYFKIDAERSDFTILSEVIPHVKPKLVQFEVHRPSRQLPQFRELLRDYLVPEAVDGYGYYAITCPRDDTGLEPSWLGFAPHCLNGVVGNQVPSTKAY